MIDKELRHLVCGMRLSNVGWGAPRIHGELLELGTDISQATISKYRVHYRKPSSPMRQTFLNNHAKDIVSTDFFTGPTAAFCMLYVEESRQS